VQFWKQGDLHSYPGYTTNISTTGMFLATRSPLPQGTRVRVEVLERDRGFMVEGVVAHARKVRSELMQIIQPGMGIRFLTVSELVRELMPGIPWGEEEIPSTPQDSDGVAEPYLSPEAPEEGPEAPSQAPVPPPPVAAPDPRPFSSPIPDPPQAAGAPLQAPAPAAAPSPADPPVPGTAGGGSFTVGFASPAEFLEVFQRDIVNGGLFVPTRYPGRLQETVLVDLVPPVPYAEPVRIRARVVHRFEPHSADISGVNLLSGMGLELQDLPQIIEQLRPSVERLRAGR
jgi:Tfp pilus assembly protein PilZ